MKHLFVVIIFAFVLSIGAWTVAYGTGQDAKEKEKKTDELKQGQQSDENQETNLDTNDDEISAEEVRAKTEAAYIAAKKYLSQQTKEYQRTLNLKLDDVNQELDRLHQRAKQEKPKMEQKLKEEQTDLEQRKEVLQKELDDLNEKATERLDEVKKRLNETLADLEQFIDETFNTQ